jgi:histidinol dehydrogenase
VLQDLPWPELPEDVTRAFDVAYANIKAFHEAQRGADLEVQTMPGVTCRRVTRAINAVGAWRSMTAAVAAAGAAVWTASQAAAAAQQQQQQVYGVVQWAATASALAWQLHHVARPSGKSCISCQQPARVVSLDHRTPSHQQTLFYSAHSLIIANSACSLHYLLAGVYVPGGTAVLPSSALMLAVPAQIAGCSTVVLATPPRPDGSITPEVLYCAKKAGVTHILKAGGAQAVAAMAWGTQTCPKVRRLDDSSSGVPIYVL